MKDFFPTLYLLTILPISGALRGEDFRFPGGDAGRGREAFTMLNCVQCHRVQGVELEDPKTPRRLNLSLGNEIRFVKKYEDLIIAISNPQHVVDKQYTRFLQGANIEGEITAFMTDLTEDMSVRQLMDLVTFLDKVYRENLDDYGTFRN